MCSSLWISIDFNPICSLKCPVVAHWNCLASFQRDEILKAIQEKDLAELGGPDDALDKPKKRSELDVHESTDFICGLCFPSLFFHNFTPKVLASL